MLRLSAYTNIIVYHSMCNVTRSCKHATQNSLYIILQHRNTQL
jgi:hypothetical protein